jgi:F-type H+-transporting ATPase subunit gamma
MPAETPRDIRRRIRATRNMAQITRAMQQVATARLRRAQMRVSEARPYAESIRDVLAGLAAQSGADITHPLLVQRQVSTVGIIEVTPDRGLCGALPTNINRTVSRFVLEQQHPVRAYAIGRRAREFLRRTGVPLAGEETNLGDYPELNRVLPIARLVMDEYGDGTVDQVYLAYTQFVSMLRQEPVIRRLIPVEPPEQLERAIYYLYEPEPADVLNGLLPRYIEVQVYHAVLESKASEQAARLVAMRNATDNANELIGDLTLSLNKARQASITKEITEIAAGAEALA